MDCVEVVQNLSQLEKNSILSVLQRDEQLRVGQEQKISLLKKEINQIRMCSVLRAGDDQSKICLRCRSEMGILFNRGSLCPSCKHKVCKNCQEIMFNGSWLCILCYKQRQLKWISGEWAASFEQNPLRKWASGSDLVKSSMQLVPGSTSIDIDESPSNHGNNKQGKKVARNGVGGADQGRSRVEVPKEGDQLKLSELFNVLRVKKPEEKVVQETQVRRITSRKYSESDSDSSSNSDIDIRSTSTAPSVTESELDGRRVESPRGLESPRSLESPPPRIVEPPVIAAVNRQAERYPLVKNVESNEYRAENGSNRPRSSPRENESNRPRSSPRENESNRPRPSPRSPKPAARRKVKSENLEQENLTTTSRPRAKERRSGGTERVIEGQVAMSRSMEVKTSSRRSAEENEQSDKGSVHSELNLHVAKTRESLDKKSRSQASLDSRQLDSNSAARPKTKEQVIRKSADNLPLESKRPMNADQRPLNKSDNQLDRTNGAELENKRRAVKTDVKVVKSSSSSGSREPIFLDNSQNVVKQIDIEVFDDTDIQQRPSSDNEQLKLISSKDDEGHTQRTGSPYSFSMDSLPSSHPSPTLNRCSFSSNPDSDTDSLSRLKTRPDTILEQSPSSSTVSAKSKGDTDKEDVVVEEISKVQFRRISKTVGQLGAMAKMSLSPNRKKLASARDSPRDSPRTISECSISQDDSGNVSGGSRGTTPEHRRTDSSYSQSSIPSTLSNVTDEDEDIDNIVARVQKQNRSNLLSVFGDSRESLASYYSDAGDIAYSNIPITGEILFSLNYNYKTNMLEVGVKQCRNIAVADLRRRRSDPYVKTYLLPDRTRGGKRKTKVKKHSTSPTFDETLKYSLTKSELENRTLWLTVWHNDRFGRNVFLGEVTINFDYYKFEDPFPRWYPLQERMDAPPPSMMVYKGDLSLCIKFVPADKLGASSSGKQKKDSGKGQLQVMVKEARNLTAVKSNGFSDPFCKGYLLPERHKSSKQKTAVVKKDCSPVWNHTFIFEDVTLTELRERCLELTIWDYEKLASNDFLGGVRLNLGSGVSGGKQVDWMDARGEEMSMWQAMLDRPNFWIDGALILRPNMDKRKY
ncbi:synaptotagmin-like protein 4 isoform X4 [Ruditapes philippinarum]|uniref:synaptotagmin-like protein 4 isoform X4 n=1 Tax=Ruditapes philippinarum TaxID=129788 RepID=UPI00295B9EF5|nr:synaptotagmin-like protein 4 isoform X4 [Ruditapes philippinarum]